MPTFLIDGGYFVGRFQKHNYTKGNRKNMNWWVNHHKQGNCNESAMIDNCNRIFRYDLTYIQMKMEEMGIIDRVIVCYDGILGRRGRGKLYGVPDHGKSSLPLLPNMLSLLPPNMLSLLPPNMSLLPKPRRPAPSLSPDVAKMVRPCCLKVLLRFWLL